MLYELYQEYLTPIEIEDATIKFKLFSDVTFLEKEQLIKMYLTLFNADNKKFLSLKNIKGITSEEGLWSEEPYVYENTSKIIYDYTTDNYLAMMSYVNSKNLSDTVLGACILQKRDKTKLKEKGYIIPFNIPKNVDYWCVIDTFRRPITSFNKPIKNLAAKMRLEITKHYKGLNPVLIYSSTNNPQMVASWKNDGFNVIEKDTTFGNKFQAYKLIV